jgi:hypothetical protein
MIVGLALAALLVLPFAAANADEETTLQPGDRVTVTAPRAPLMRGQQTVGMVRRGQELEVLKVEGNWIGTTADFRDRQVGGWIWFRQVAPAEGELAQRATRRRFSFEPEGTARAPAPAPRTQTQRPAEPRTARQPSYTLPKTDPNRFR